MSSRKLYFCGDPHGDFSSLHALAATEPGTVVVVGDFDLTQPVTVALAPLFAAGWTVKWILGNHDSDTCEQLTYLIHPKTGHLGGDLNARVEDLEGIQVAGLAGTFKGKIWDPKFGAPRYPTRSSWKAEHRQRWQGGMPIHLRDAVWHEDAQVLGRYKADILVTHEGPSSVWKAMGYEAIDDLAAKMEASWVVHGHHHHSGVSRLPSGTFVKALGIAEIWQYPY